MTMRFETLEMGKVFESKHNPRRHFDEAALTELVLSIKQVGMLTPLLVRPRAKGGVEIAAGHRRYRAAKLAGFDTIPCLVREMDDQAFMEILTIDNLQRSDVHPLDEAKGYDALMAAPYRMDVQTIADKVGRSVTYVYDRIKLLSLTADAQAFFWDGKIEAGQAIVLARLTPTEQEKVIGTKAGHYLNGGLFQAEHDLYDEKPGDEEPIKARSVAEVQAWIKRHVRFNAKQADTFLFPETVAQVTEATEDQRKIIEITHEYLANEDVRRASADRVYGERAWKRADGKEDSRECDRSVLGVIVSGSGQGEAFQVCISKDRCLVHWGAEVKAKQKKAQTQPNSPAAKAAEDKAVKARKAEQDQYARQQQRRDHWKQVSPKIEAAVLAKVKLLPVAADGVLGDLLIKAFSGIKMTAVPRGKTAEDLLRHLGALVLVGEIRSWHAAEEFPKIAKALGVDLSGILKAEAPVMSHATTKTGKKTKATV